MDINNVAMSQQITGGASHLNTVEKINNEQVKSSSEEVQVMTKKSIGGVKENYTAVSQDGDTLILSEKIKTEGISQKETKGTDGKVITTTVKMTDAALSKCSSQKLRQLLQQGKISRQQYNKIMNKHKS